jgi:hypothetical protein
MRGVQVSHIGIVEEWDIYGLRNEIVLHRNAETLSAARFHISVSVCNPS